MCEHHVEENDNLCLMEGQEILADNDRNIDLNLSRQQRKK